MGRRSTSIFAICLMCGLGALITGWRVTALSAAPTPVPRAVYRTAGGITQAYLAGYPLWRAGPRDSAHYPHISALFSLLRLSHPQAPATYIRLHDTRRGLSFEMAATPYSGTQWKRSPAYDLALVGGAGGTRRVRAAWMRVGTSTFGLFALSASFQPTTAAVVMVQSIPVAARVRPVLRVTFMTRGRNGLSLVSNRTDIAPDSVFSLLMQARLSLTPVRPVPTLTPTPAITPTPLPSPTPVPVRGDVTPTAVSLNAPTPARAALIHALHGVWQPSSVSVGLNAAVTWENDDTSSAYSVECVQAQSSAPCPWGTPLQLPAASGGTTPTVSVTFIRPGIFIFRDGAHPGMQGEVVVGAPGRP